MAIGLGLAKAISENLKNFNGKIKLIFQSAEEGTRGAKSMGKMVDDVDFLFGIHIGIGAKQTGSIICGTNKFLATTKFDCFLQGISAHAAASPQNGANALLTACNIALNLHAITRHSDGQTMINVGKLIAGEGRNVVAPNAVLSCETRGDTTELNDFMYKKACDIIKGACQMQGVSYEIIQTGGTGGGDSDNEITELFYNASLQSPFVNNEYIMKNCDFKACKDFAYLMKIVQSNGKKSGYAMIGANLSADHHNGKFDFDEKCLLTGLDVLLRVLYMKNQA